jgi:hypothetical protein
MVANDGLEVFAFVGSGERRERGRPRSFVLAGEHRDAEEGRNQRVYRREAGVGRDVQRLRIATWRYSGASTRAITAPPRSASITSTEAPSLAA